MKEARNKKARAKIPAKQLRKRFWWVLLLAVWVFASTIASQFIVGFIMTRILGGKIDRPIWTAVYQAISYLIALVLVILVPLLMVKKNSKESDKNSERDAGSFNEKLTREEMGLSGTPTWTDIGLSPIGYVAAVLGSAGLTWLFSLLPWFNVAEKQDVGFSYYMDGGERAVAFILLVVIAPIIEEVIFRGWLYGKLRARLNLPISIIITSLLFGLVHLQWNVAVDVFALSVVACVLREITGTIYAGVLMHMLKNGIAFYLVYVMMF